MSFTPLLSSSPVIVNSLLKPCIHFPPGIVSGPSVPLRNQALISLASRSVRRINWAIIMWQSHCQTQRYKDESSRSSSERDRIIKRNIYDEIANAWVLYLFTWKSLFQGPVVIGISPFSLKQVYSGIMTCDKLHIFKVYNLISFDMRRCLWNYQKSTSISFQMFIMFHCNSVCPSPVLRKPLILFVTID